MTRLIFIEIQATLIVFGKYVIILKEIKKPRRKVLRVLAKNQLRFEIFVKIFKFTYKNLNGKLIFYPLSLPSSRRFVILYTYGTYKNFGGRGAVIVIRASGGVLSSLGWIGELY